MSEFDRPLRVNEGSSIGGGTGGASAGGGGSNASAGRSGGGREEDPPPYTGQGEEDEPYYPQSTWAWEPPQLKPPGRSTASDFSTQLFVLNEQAVQQSSRQRRIVRQTPDAAKESTVQQADTTRGAVGPQPFIGGPQAAREASTPDRPGPLQRALDRVEMMANSAAGLWVGDRRISGKTSMESVRETAQIEPGAEPTLGNVARATWNLIAGSEDIAITPIVGPSSVRPNRPMGPAEQLYRTLEGTNATPAWGDPTTDPNYTPYSESAANMAIQGLTQDHHTRVGEVRARQEQGIYTDYTVEDAQADIQAAQGVTRGFRPDGTPVRYPGDAVDPAAAPMRERDTERVREVMGMGLSQNDALDVLTPEQQILYRQFVRAQAEPEVVYNERTNRYDWIGDVPGLGPVLNGTRDIIGRLTLPLESSWVIVKATPARSLPIVGEIRNPREFSIVEVNSAGLDVATELAFGEDNVWKVVRHAGGEAPDLTLNGDLWSSNTSTSAPGRVLSAVAGHAAEEMRQELDRRHQARNVTPMDVFAGSRVTVNGITYYNAQAAQLSPEELEALRSGAEKAARILASSDVDTVERAVQAIIQAPQLASIHESIAREAKLAAHDPASPLTKEQRDQAAMYSAGNEAMATEYANYTAWQAVVEHEQIWRDIGLSMLPFFAGGDPLGAADTVIEAIQFGPKMRRINQAIEAAQPIQAPAPAGRLDRLVPSAVMDRLAPDDYKRLEDLAIEGVSPDMPLSEAADMNDNYVRNRLVTGRFFDYTADSAAKVDASKLHPVFTYLLSDVEYMGDAQKILHAWLTDPKALAVDGLSGFVSKRLKDMESAGGPVKWDAKALADPGLRAARNSFVAASDEIFAALPTYRVKAMDLIANLDEMVYKGGLKTRDALEHDVPAFARTARVTTERGYEGASDMADVLDPDANVTAGKPVTRYYVDYADGTGETIWRTELPTRDAADARVKQANKLIGETELATKNLLRTVSGFQRQLISASWLTFNPGFIVQNAISAATHTGVVDRTFTFKPSSEMDAWWGQRAGQGIQPTTRLQRHSGGEAESYVDRATGQKIKYKDVVARAETWARASEQVGTSNTATTDRFRIGERDIQFPSGFDRESFLESEGIDVAEEILPGREIGIGSTSDYMQIAGDRKINVMDWPLVKSINNLWQGDVPFLGEENYVKRVSMAAGQRAWQLTWEDEIRRSFSEILTTTELGAQEREALVNSLVEAGMQGSREDVARAFNDMLDGKQAPFRLTQLGRDLDGVLDDENLSRLYRFIDNSTESDPEAFFAEVQGIFDDASKRYGRILSEAPKPYRRGYFTKWDAVKDQSHLADSLIQAGTNAGRPEEQVREIIDNLTTRIHQGESQLRDVLRQQIEAGAAHGRRIRVIFDTLRQKKSQARHGQQELFDKWYPIGVDGQDARAAAWDGYFNDVERMWSTYADDTLAYTTDISERIAAGAQLPDYWQELERKARGGTLPEQIRMRRKTFEDGPNETLANGIKNFEPAYSWMFAEVDGESVLLSSLSTPGNLIRASDGEVIEDFRVAASNDMKDNPSVTRIYTVDKQSTDIEVDLYRHDPNWADERRAMREDAEMAEEVALSSVEEQRQFLLDEATNDVLLSEFPDVTPEMEAVEDSLRMVDPGSLSDRNIELGRMSVQSEELYQRVRDANRLFADVHAQRMADAASRYYSPASLDIVMSAEKTVDNMGAMTSARLQAQRDNLFDGLITLTQYHRIRNQAWFDLAEAAAHTYNEAVYEIAREFQTHSDRMANGFDTPLGRGEVVGKIDDDTYSVSINGKKIPMPVSSNGMGVPPAVARAFDSTPESSEQAIEEIADEILRERARASEGFAEVEDMLDDLIRDEVPRDGDFVADPGTRGMSRSSAADELDKTFETMRKRLDEPLSSPTGHAAHVGGLPRDGSGDGIAILDDAAVEMGRTGATAPPSVYDYASHGNEMLDSGLQRIKDDLPQVMKGTPLDLSPNEVARLRAWAGENLTQTYNRATFAAQNAADSMASFSMVNYSGGRFIDDMLGLMVPYHFWYTRSAKNWTERAINRPAMMALINREVAAVDQANEREGNPGRYGGRVNIGTGNDGVSYHAANPLLWAGIPYLPNYLGGLYETESRARSQLDEFQSVGRTIGFGLYPWLDAVVNVADDRADEVNVSQWTPQGDLAGAAASYASASYVRGTPEWYRYLVAREAAYMSVRDGLSESSALEDTNVPGVLAIQDYLAQEARGLDALPNQEEFLAQENIDAAWQGAMGDKIFHLGTKWLLGLSVTRQQPEDAVLRQMQADYFNMGYPANEFGSYMAENAFLREYPELQTWWARNQILPTDGYPFYPATPEAIPGSQEWVGDGGVEFFNKSPEYEQGRPGMTLGRMMRDEALDRMNLDLQVQMDETILRMSQEGAPAWEINQELFRIRNYYHDDETGYKNLIFGEFHWVENANHIGGDEPNPYRKMNPSEAALSVMHDLVAMAEKEFEDMVPFGHPGPRPQIEMPDNYDSMSYQEKNAFWTKERNRMLSYKLKMEAHLKQRKDYEEAITDYIDTGMRDLSMLVEISGGYPMEESEVQRLLDVLADEHTPLDISPEILNQILKAEQDSRRPNLADEAGLVSMAGDSGMGALLSHRWQYDSNVMREFNIARYEEQREMEEKRTYWTDNPRAYTQGGYWRAYRKRYGRRWRRWKRWGYYRNYRRRGRRYYRRNYRRYRFKRWSKRWRDWKPWPRRAWGNNWKDFVQYPGVYEDRYNGLPSWLQVAGSRRYFPPSMTNMMDQRPPSAPPVEAWDDRSIMRFDE